jgi:hypothetical protein
MDLPALWNEGVFEGHDLALVYVLGVLRTQGINLLDRLEAQFSISALAANGYYSLTDRHTFTKALFIVVDMTYREYHEAVRSMDALMALLKTDGATFSDLGLAQPKVSGWNPDDPVS